MNQYEQTPCLASAELAPRTAERQFASQAKRRHGAGFTLTELLVVMGIIAVLAAILLPVLSRAKEKSRKTTCLNNQKQIGLAVTQYIPEHEEKFPKEWNNAPTAPLTTPNSSSPTGAYCNNGFDSALQPHLQSRKVFVCPSDTYLNRNISTAGGRNKWDDTSFGINAYVEGQAETVVKNATDTILLAHTRFEHVIWRDQHNVMWDTHAAGDNYVFCDGHVSSLKKEATCKPRNLWEP